MRNLLLILISLVLVLACSKEDDANYDTNSSMNPLQIQLIDFGECFSGSGNYDSVVIQNEAAYEILEDSLWQQDTKECDTASLPYIDFSEHTLLAKWTGISGCSAEYDRKVFRNDDERTYVYQIEVTSIGLCEMLIYDMNWVLVPKLPPGWNVKFEVEYNFSQ